MRFVERTVLNHPNIAQIHGLEASGPIRALVMELVAGDDLSTVIARGPMAPADAPGLQVGKPQLLFGRAPSASALNSGQWGHIYAVLADGKGFLVCQQRHQT